MTIPIYRLLEITVYTFLLFVPPIFIALWPFRRHLRFSPAISNVLIILLCILQVWISMLTVLSHTSTGALYLIRSCVYALFYFAIIKTESGKLIFTLLSLSNIGNLVSVCAKCLERVLFNTTNPEPYRWSLCLCVLFMQLIITVPLCFYIRKLYGSIVQATHFAWRYLWIIPFIFYIIWYYHLFLTDQSGQAVLNIQSTMYLVIINLGAFLIYHIEVLLIKEKDSVQKLLQQNYLLTMQKLQYDCRNWKLIWTTTLRPCPTPWDWFTVSIMKQTQCSAFSIVRQGTIISKWILRFSSLKN